ncbi:MULTISPECIES: 2-oxoglutarate dehydrogenase complex dihydrolipoyllysine-residue succinyltransferase [Vogesella]|jgi:2-oxoglutarate dehydrogenase E2 component (dihydrolipoamide succinyltransferase)|uniref:Dihydrolipoyllysine-residue succinyltransferase component of 2-oxoglutarate dehydrogenase complex n=1 Tax=Vogesella indigofera TaxID=45465 RepID=A0A495BFK1_VOGIN|nr:MULTISPECIES: 2-oxoglutarate dehydrogenase complex dihydrolipoyllysine-residue succinyltransferase [Vogesella]MCQ4143894.1 2-oxoglutarate dehydrogenase complex dihydrolipoyllysine-residue succinyltransferase [Vogesella sp. AC12]MDC7689976.1 2-oxoglutarate dehydrogenase complex dihydrolipoyllysine-residue succinyltransferase [Vogesella indigofera]RKQ58984.1 2-oxoglutarate dehydrogenase E2 component [Vogesella indigofera]
MAIIEVKVPQLPESVSEATLMSWHKRVGQAVARDENLIDLETDKVVLELPAPLAGVIVEIIEQDGATVVSGQLIARIDTAATAGDAAPAAAAAAPAPVAAAPVQAAAPGGAAMPSAAKLAAESGVDLAGVAGSGRDGRILKEDVAAAAAKPAPAAAKPVAPLPPVAADASGRPEQRVAMSRLRQRVAERLLQSQQTNAILTTFNEVNMKPLMDLRAKYKDKFEKEHGVKLGFMGFFVKAAVAALKKFPIVNASVDGNDIIYHGYFDIGVAVGSPRGLVVPVIRNADQLSLADIEKQIAEFGKRAQEGKLTVEELTGGTYTISNGGTFGSMMSTPIINPPQSAILGMHATKERAVVENGQVVVRPMMYLAQSYDHRIIDGREAVLSLVAIKDAIEDPARLILDL